jgi:hypothetical protein
MLMDMLSSLRKLGVALLLDDFDMGFSPQSLAFIFLSARLDRTQPTHRKKSVRPSRLDTLQVAIIPQIIGSYLC